MKKFMILLAVMLSLTGCGQDLADAQVSSDVTMNQMAEEMMDAVEFSMTMPMDWKDENAASMITESIGLTADQLSDSSLNMNMVMSADTLFLAEAKDDETVVKVKEAFQKQLSNIQQSFEQYLPDAYETAKNGVIVEKGHYVMLVISQDNEQVTKIFESHVK